MREEFNYGYRYPRHKPYSAVDYNATPGWKMEWHCYPPPLGTRFTIALRDFEMIKTKNHPLGIGCRIYGWQKESDDFSSGCLVFVRRPQEGGETWMESILPAM